ncbi:MAG: PDGLE domain-containing protein [Oligoflexia bacterium]|nr:PDGLE domain-containing protein [Oligoflexia bacterium]
MKTNKKSIVLYLGLALFLAAVVAPFASSFPDGLEWVAEAKGFLAKAEVLQIWEHSPMPDYDLRGGHAFGTSISGIVGTILVFVATFVFSRMLSKRRLK